MAIICRSAAGITNINKKNCVCHLLCVSCLLCTSEHRTQAAAAAEGAAQYQLNVVMLLVDTILKPKLMTLLPKMCKSTMAFYFVQLMFLGFLCRHRTHPNLLPRRLIPRSLQMKTLIFRRRIDPNQQMLLSPTLHYICLVFMHI